VVWEEPTAEEIAREEELNPAGWPGPPVRTLAEVRREEGDYVILGPAEPVWHIRAGAARRVDVDLECMGLTAIAGTVIGACQLPSDPQVRHVGPGGNSISYRSPGTIIVLDDAGTVRPVGRVPSTEGVICEDRGRVSLLGFDKELGDQQTPGPRELLLGDGRITESMDMVLHDPVGVVEGLVADLTWQTPADDPYGRTSDRSAVLRFLPVDGGEPSQVALPGLALGAEARVQDGQVWISRRGEAVLRVVKPGDATARELRVTLDCRPWMRRPQPPADLDMREFERSQFDRFRSEMRSVHVDEQGRITPLIEGVSMDAVELRGTFPDSQLVALFHSADRPAVQFGRRSSLYDELGNPVWHQWADIYLEEDITTGGLPPLGECVPDAAGIVWI
jgi:hypothetical protein